MKRLSDINFSILDLATIVRGGTAADAFARSVALAQQAERLGYTRFWLAEHHNLDGIASSATSVLIGLIAANTRSIRVGSGGVMLPNHAPLIIAEQFGTLESVYPGRIDLGLGRAPGTDGVTARALRRHLVGNEQEFADEVAELRGYLAPPRAGQHVRAIPGEGLDIPLWLLGSGSYSAQLAGQLGLPFAFASHFAPDYLLRGIELYRQTFRPSKQLAEPYVMMGVNVLAADSDAQASHIATSMKLRWLRMIRDQRGPIEAPVETMDGLWNELEAAQVNARLAASAIGSPETVARQLQALLDQTQVDEMIVVSDAYDFSHRQRSYELLAGLFNKA
ncbi:hypothetical protein JHS3_05320 [Jeongeupia sp. HS-3]|uniref:LLM class flavin-dependent oxidoreductase n=1 Tax=Jeongeupia sp. HS-3 TaxID=1009682 RepID=UPI0018A5C6E4|nr:LLM class flavin-dependent oxidoreductase [Jeongeupia sp. HS-3]BCL74796.1 hypothetical protein JHS3_05320 [Jeongeupia sp. HS-3]